MLIICGRLACGLLLLASLDAGLVRKLNLYKSKLLKLPFFVVAYVFLAFSFYQMAEWALDKHRNMHKEFDGQNGRRQYPTNRKAIIPFIL